jgi:hypothetical protein
LRRSAAFSRLFSRSLIFTAAYFSGDLVLALVNIQSSGMIFSRWFIWFHRGMDLGSIKISYIKKKNYQATWEINHSWAFRGEF